MDGCNCSVCLCRHVVYLCSCFSLFFVMFVLVCATCSHFMSLSSFFIPLVAIVVFCHLGFLVPLCSHWMPLGSLYVDSLCVSLYFLCISLYLIDFATRDINSTFPYLKHTHSFRNAGIMQQSREDLAKITMLHKADLI